jgi:hypothetical protein
MINIIGIYVETRKRSHFCLLYNWTIRNSVVFPANGQTSTGKSLLKETVVTSTGIDFRQEKINIQPLVDADENLAKLK